jgi:RimJ/RimL family protein N-acetyltransferase
MFAITERLLLRPSWPEDANALHNAVADEGIVRNLATAPWPYRFADAMDFAARQHPDHYPSAFIWLRDGGTPRLAGACGIGNRNGEVELGYWIARPFWGQGIATEAAKAMVNAARALGHKRLVASHFVDNPASGRVLRKAGFIPTGQRELRHSEGRGHSTSAVLFAQDLADGCDNGKAMLTGGSRCMRQSLNSPERRAA